MAGQSFGASQAAVQRMTQIKVAIGVLLALGAIGGAWFASGSTTPESADGAGARQPVGLTSGRAESADGLAGVIAGVGHSELSAPVTKPGQETMGKPTGAVSAVMPIPGAEGRAATGQGQRPVPGVNTPLAAQGELPPGHVVITRGDKGQLVVEGRVDDEARRSRWLNAIRLGAKGSEVQDRLDVGSAPMKHELGAELTRLAIVVREGRVRRSEISADQIAVLPAPSSKVDQIALERVLSSGLPDGIKLVRLDGPASAAPPSLAAAVVPGAPRVPSQDALSDVREDALGASGSVPASTVAPAAVQLAKAPESRSARADITVETAPLEAGRKGEQKSAQGKSGSTTMAAAKPDMGACPDDPERLVRPIYFRKGSFNLTDAERARLMLLGACLETGQTLKLVGRPDPGVSGKAARELSLRRARAVAEAIRKGIPKNVVKLEVGAVTTAQAQNTSNESGPRKRRVDIAIAR